MIPALLAAATLSLLLFVACCLRLGVSALQVWWYAPGRSSLGIALRGVAILAIGAAVGARGFLWILRESVP